MKKILFIISILLSALHFRAVAQCNADFSITPVSGEICSGNNVSFSNNSSGIFSHSWDFGDGMSSGATNPIHSFENLGSQPDTFEVKLYLNCLTDGKKDTFSLEIKVNPSTEANFSLGKTEVCAITDSICPTNLTLDNVGNQYFWDFGTPPVKNEKDPCFTYFSNDTFDIELIVINQYGCEDRHNEQIVVKEAPNPDFSIVPFAGCVPLSVQFVNTTNVGTSPIISWDWLLGNGDSSSLKDPPNITYPSEDTFFVSLRTLNQTGCENTTVKPVLVGPRVEVNINSPDTACPNTYYNLSSTTSIPVSYTQWFVEDAVFQSGSFGNSVNVQWTSGGIKQIVAKGVLTGCDSYDTTYIYVHPVQTIDYFYVDSNVVCPNEDVLVAVEPAGFNEYTFIRQNGDTLQNSSSNAYQFSNLLTNESFYVSTVDDNSCVIYGIAQQIIVKNIPSINLSTSSVTNTFCVEEDVLVNATSIPSLSYDFYEDFILVQSGISNSYLADSMLNESFYHVVVNDGLCSKNSDTIQISLVDSILPPQVNCGATTVNSIDFIWDSVINANSYEVSLDGGSFFLPSGNLIHSVTGLMPDDSMRIIVKVLANAPCNDITYSDTVVCYARDCPLLNFSLEYDTICEGDSFKIKATNIVSPSDSLGFSWGGNIYIEDSSFFIFPVTSSLQTLSVSMIDSSSYLRGCPAVSKSVSFQPIEKKELSILPIGNYCEFDDISIVASPTTFTNYDFYIDGILEQSSNIPAFVLDSVSGTYNVRIEAASSSCGMEVLDTNLVFNSASSLSLQASPDSICFNGSISVTALPNSMTEYEFYRDNIIVQSSNSNVLNLDLVQLASEVYVVADNGNCPAYSDTIRLNVIDSIQKPNMFCGTSTLNSVQVNWNPVSDASLYEVSVNGSAYTVPSSGAFGLEHLLSGLNPSENVDFVVRAVASSPCNDISYSDTLTCKTLDCPIINFDLVYNETSYCEGDSLLVTATNIVSSSDSIGFSWDGGIFKNDTTFFIQELDSLNVDVSVEMVDSSLLIYGCPSVMKNVFVDPISLNELDIELPDTICEYTDIDITAVPNTFLNYEFIIDGSTVQNSIVNIYTLTNISGNYDLELVAVDSKCPLDTFKSDIQIALLPILTLNKNPNIDSICEGSEYSLSVLPSGLKSYTFFENNIVIQDSISNIFVNSNDSSGIFEYYVTAQDDNGCILQPTDTLNYTIISKPIFEIDTSFNQNSPCDTMFYSMNVLLDTFDLYTFQVNDSIFESFEGHLEGVLDSIINISVTIESTNGCQSIDSVTLIKPEEESRDVGGAFSIMHSSCNLYEHKIWEFDGLSFKDYINVNGGEFNLEGGGAIPIEELDTIIKEGEITFPEETEEEYIFIITRLFYTDTLGCQKKLSISDSFRIPKFIHGYDTLLCLYNPETNLKLNTYVDAFNSNMTSGFFAWDTSSYITDRYKKSFDFTPETPGSYDFSFYECLDDSGQCCNKETFSYCIPDCNPFIPNAISPNDDDKNEKWELTNLWGTIKVSIYNRWGELVYQENDYKNTWEGVDVNGKILPEGAYFFIIEVDGFTYKHDERPKEKLIKRVLGAFKYKEEVVYSESEWSCEKVPYEPIKGTIIIER